MASKKAQELAEQLLGIAPNTGSRTVENILAGGQRGCGMKFGGSVDTIKGFYYQHKNVVNMVGGVALVAAVIGVGMTVMKKKEAETKNDKQ